MVVGNLASLTSLYSLMCVCVLVRARVVLLILATIAAEHRVLHAKLLNNIINNGK